MKPVIPVTLIIAGAILSAAPLTYSFILSALDEPAVLDHGTKTICMVLGMVLVGVGIVLSFFAQRSGGSSAK